MDVSMDRSSAESARTGEQIQRLYPSLPNTNRLEVCVVNRSSPNNLDTTHHLETLGISQAQGCAVRWKAQIQVLEEQKQELLSINERWAKEYRIMVQYYKDKLRNLKASLPQQNCPSEDRSEKSTHLCKLNTLKDITQAGSGDVSDVLVKVQSEAKQLQEQNKTLARRGQHQNAEIARLNKALEEARGTSPSQEMSSETLRDIWKHQAEVYKEDFLKEREDRTTLKGKYLQLEKKYKTVRNELYAIKSQDTWTTSEPQNKCTCTQRNTSHNNETQSRLYTFKNKL